MQFFLYVSFFFFFKHVSYKRLKSYIFDLFAMKSDFLFSQYFINLYLNLIDHYSLSKTHMLKSYVNLQWGFKVYHITNILIFKAYYVANSLINNAEQC